MGSAERIATRFLTAGFAAGDYILFGKFRNKRGKVIRVFADDRGIPYIEVQPIPKGRKKNRTFGLYTIRKMTPEAIAEAEAMEAEEGETAAKVAARFARNLLAHTPAENIAINLLVNNPDMSLEEALVDVERGGQQFTEVWDSVSRTWVAPHEVAKALKELEPKPLSGGDTRVYHATDASTAKMLLRRGFIPETKPRRTVDEYSPGHGLDRGLYVGLTPRDVDGYGRAILEVIVPKKFLEVPTELAQLGEKDPMRALRSHDGAIINHRLPPDAFRLLP